MAIETPEDTLWNQIDILSDRIDSYKMIIEENRKTIDRERTTLKEREEYCKSITRQCGESIDTYEKAISSTLRTIEEYENAISCLELNGDGQPAGSKGQENGK